ncbi:hypothetical protein HN51_019346 [Arachis hypogaea]|uniref:Uncharacterized protein LOC107462069 n=2 Tax=Arachis TaxID=3817 RepID=A0A6P4C236_ARADU|nr:uncharacterized protein LOC107462069 [Arachis duranensis]XP_025614249.1 protein phosphatase 1 regulatory subunit 7 [Arachis hypogaea]XP_052112280.1 uncharacterized protein LOC127744050 [Arachis duranensis]QHO31093.1 Protein phosphatase 1 regulatory subunit [Arachis hypogaea]RYR43100.1 hypothetical protein Ahy_A08g039528 [Arachis hypogaea]
MARLSLEQVLKDNNGDDPSSITSLQLNHKALSDVSCLSSFSNLEKLDLKLNNLTSLEGLRSCVNLKWLSVLENKLETLEGIQGLTKLTVLNAGKNKLRSMDEVRSLVSLRALILNENEIASICKLDELKELNTIVLSKNPIRKIGGALTKVKSITKLSLSHCQLQGIDCSLKSCVELRELRLAHNEIQSLPDELAQNSKLQNLDLGNNVITKWSELKVLKSLTNLRNLNLQGNPVASIEKVTRKVKKALPKLRIFNARPVDKDAKNEKCDEDDGGNDFSVDQVGQNMKDSTKDKKRARFHGENDDDHAEIVGDPGFERKSSKKKKKTVDDFKKEVRVTDEENTDHNKKSTKKKLKNDDNPTDKELAPQENVTRIEKKHKKKQKNEKQSELDVIDDAEASFVELFNTGDTENLNHVDETKQEKVPKDAKQVDSTSISFTKRKSTKTKNMESQSDPLLEIGMGGPSTWGDD